MFLIRMMRRKPQRYLKLWKGNVKLSDPAAILQPAGVEAYFSWSESDLALPLPAASVQPLSFLRKDNHNQNYKEKRLKELENSPDGWMNGWRKASSFSSIAELSVSQKKLKSERYGPCESKRRKYIRNAPWLQAQLNWMQI